MTTDWHAFLILNMPQHVALIGMSSCARPLWSVVAAALGPDDVNFILRLASSLNPTTTPSGPVPAKRSTPSIPAAPPSVRETDDRFKPHRACLATMPRSPETGQA